VSGSQIPPQTGKVAVVTGANGGLGYYVAKGLAEASARVVLACRDTTRGAEALRRLQGEVPGADLVVRQLDLADLSSVRRCAAEVLAENDGVDILVNNAGVMAVPLRRTADGFELQFGTNHLGHFALTGLLLRGLLTRPGARVVTVSSFMHRVGRIDFADLDAERGYHKWVAYTQSKLANLLFAFELHRRAEAARVGLISVAAHPGWAATRLHFAGPEMSGNIVEQLAVRAANMMYAQSAEGGAKPLLHAATAPDVRGGELYGPLIPTLRGPTRRERAASPAYDVAVAQRLWAESEARTGVSYDLLPKRRSGDRA
jgi:NAD(P)-dependent dehydrogenase (short-subunit alcohol dehydrogenase family)